MAIPIPTEFPWESHSSVVIFHSHAHLYPGPTYMHISSTKCSRLHIFAPVFRKFSRGNTRRHHNWKRDIRLSSCTLDPAVAPTQTAVLGLLRIIFQIKITLVSTVAAFSEGLHLMSYTNDLLLSMHGAIGEIFCVWKIQRIRQICRLCGTSKS